MVNSGIRQVFVAVVSHRQTFNTDLFSRADADRSSGCKAKSFRRWWRRSRDSSKSSKCDALLFVTASNYLMSLNCYKFAMNPIQQEASNLEIIMFRLHVKLFKCMCVCVFSVPFASKMTTFKRRQAKGLR